MFRTSHFINDLNFNVNEPVRVEVAVQVDFATSLNFKTQNIYSGTNKPALNSIRALGYFEKWGCGKDR